MLVHPAGRTYGMKKEDLVDFWGEPVGYEYSDSEDACILWSAGPDKKPGTSDDVILGWPPPYMESWKAKHLPSVDGQGTNALQAATPEPVWSPVAPGKKTPGRVAAKDTPLEDAPTETNAAPWKLPLFIGVVVIGATGIWRCLKRRKRGGDWDETLRERHVRHIALRPRVQRVCGL